MELEEAGNMTIRGISKIIGAPLMITFYNHKEQLFLVPRKKALMHQQMKEIDSQHI